MRRFLQLLVLLLCFTAIVCKTSTGRRRRSSKKKTATDNVDEENGDFTADSVSTSHWIDPHNMVDDNPVHLKPTSAAPEVKKQDDGLIAAFGNVQDQLRECQAQIQTYSNQGPPKELPNCDSPHLKQLVQSLLKATSDVNPYTEIKLSSENREVLMKFLEDQANIHDLIEMLKASIADKTIIDSWKENYLIYIRQHLDIGTLLLIAFILFIVISVIVFEMKTRLTIRQQFFYLLIVSFVVSIPWEWFRLYKKAFADKQSMIMKDIEKHCHTDHELGFTESIRLWYKSSFTFGDSSCSKYQEALLVDPIWEVPPSKAVSVTITRFIVEPFELFADATGKSFRALFQHLPMQWQPLMFLACFLVIILCLILVSGIRISTPFLQIGLGVDPAVAAAGLQRLEQQMKQLNERHAAAIQTNTPPAIQNVAVDDNRNSLNAVLNQINAINERSQGQGNQLKEIKEFLLRLKPVAEQARQAEAIEHLDWEVVGNGEVLEQRAARQRRPVQASEHHPTESNSP